MEKPLCPEPSRLDDWFLGVVCAGSQHPAPGASLPDVHEEFTGHGRHLLLPETDLLTPPPSPPSVVQLGVTGVPPVERSVAMQVCPYTVSTRQGKPYLLKVLVWFHPARLMWPVEMLPPPNATALLQVLQAKSTEGHARGWSRSGSSAPSCSAPDLAPRATKVMARSLGRAMSTLVVQERHLWLCLVDIGTKFGSSRLLLPPPVRRLQRPGCSSPRAAPCIHPRSRTASAAASKSGAVKLGVGRPPRPSWPPSTGGNQHRTTLILPLASRQQWTVREHHQRLLTHPLPNYGSR